jgi:flagellar biosynthesis protein FlhF
VLQRELATFARGQYARRAPVRARTIQRLLRIGFGESLAGEVAREMRNVEVDETAWREALAHLGNRIRIAGLNPLHASGVIALTGPTGVGKTTTAAKLASTAAQRYGRDAVALVAMQDEALALQSPLLGIGQRLGIATGVASSAEGLRHTLGSLVGRRLVVIDTTGTSLQAGGNAWQLDALQRIRGLQRLVVVAANTHYDDLRAALRAYGSPASAGCVLTKLDESAVFGSALSAVIEEAVPIALTTDGQQMDSGLQRPSVYKLVSRAVRVPRSRWSDEPPVSATHGRESHDVL